MSATWFTPAKESLLAKRSGLEQSIQLLMDAGPTPALARVLRRCQETLAEVKRFDAPWSPNHPHLAWRLLHRVDQELLLVISTPELLAAAETLRATFDMNVTEPKLRRAWLGSETAPGLLPGAIATLRARPDDEAARHLLAQARRLVDDQTDRDFWTLSVNTLTSVASGLALGGAMVAFWLLGWSVGLAELGAKDLTEAGLGRLALLGLMGGYLSNVLTREGFLYVRGGPFWRYVLLHLVSRPVLSAFAAILLALLVKAELILGFGPQAKGSALVVLQVGERVGYAFAALALVAGFAADKLLRDLIGRVLKQLEQKAEKSKESPEPATAAGTA